MKKCLIVGRPRVGKTLFFIHFSKYLGLNELPVTLEYLNGDKCNKILTIQEATDSLCTNNPFGTPCLQKIELNLSLLKGPVRLQLIDSPGLHQGIHHDTNVRRCMAQTLKLLNECDVILHLIDVSNYGKDPIHGLDKIDFQLAQFGISHQGYIILANKVDLLQDRTKLAQLQRDYPLYTIIPISTLTMQGFNEVKAYCSYQCRGI